jgi:hypothetical protein
MAVWVPLARKFDHEKQTNQHEDNGDTGGGFAAGIMMTTGCAHNGRMNGCCAKRAMLCDGSCCKDSATCAKCCTDAAGCAKCCKK